MVEHSSYPDRLKWAFEQGSKNLAEKFATGDNMNKEVQTTLTYVLAAMGVTSAYAFKGLEAALTVPVFTSAVMCLFYTVLGIWFAKCVFLIGEFPSPYQEPLNLIQDPEIGLDVVMKAEIKGLAERIDDATKWITRKSEAINKARTWLVWSPFVAVGVAGVAVLFKLVH